MREYCLELRDPKVIPFQFSCANWPNHAYCFGFPLKERSDILKGRRKSMQGGIVRPKWEREAFPSIQGKIALLKACPRMDAPTWACLLLPTPSYSRHIPSGHALSPCQDLAGIFQHNHLLAALSQRDIGDVYIPSNGPDPWRQLLYGRNFNVMQ